MVARIQVALLAVIAAFALTFSVATKASADDKKGCEVCAAVGDVNKTIVKCAGCAKPTAGCDHCAKAAAADANRYKCKDCVKDKTCDHCKKFLDDCKGDKVAAAKKLMESKTFCCKNCEKAGEEKAAKCQKCVDARKKIEDAEVKK